MAKRGTTVDEVFAEISRDPVRGEIFWWLYDNYDQIEAGSVGRRLSWKRMVARVTDLGLKDGAGNTTPKPRALRRTFDRVCKLRRREAEAWEKSLLFGNSARRTVRRRSPVQRGGRNRRGL